MMERPILFSGPLVKAILDGKKTVTRRLVKLDRWSSVEDAGRRAWPVDRSRYSTGQPMACPFGRAGDHLYVRETHAIVPASAYRCSREEDGSHVPHRVSPDGTGWAIYREGWTRSPPQRWLPSIHMPRWASRIDLEITDVRVERLQEITEEDARAEGVESVEERLSPNTCIGRDQTLTTGERMIDSPFRASFAWLWDELYGDHATWKSNPWVWHIAFRRVERAARAA